MEVGKKGKQKEKGRKEGKQGKQVAKGQYVVSDNRCPALHNCELE